MFCWAHVAGEYEKFACGGFENATGKANELEQPFPDETVSCTL